MPRGFYERCAIAKPEPRKRVRARAKRTKAAHVKAVRQYVFAREQQMCRCCEVRPAESMHEIIPRSLGGKVSKENSIALCGSGTTGCHGLCQQHEILICGTSAEERLDFQPVTPLAHDWVYVGLRPCRQDWP